MPWLAIPFQDSRINALSDRFDIEGIPSLIILDPNGDVVTKDAVSRIRSDPNGLKFPFHPEPVVDISV
jgi:nucleoredoxin